MDTATWILDHAHTFGERSVLLTLWELSEHAANVQISYSRIGKRACVAIPTVKRAVKRLESSGAVTVTRGPNSSIPNTYRLNVENV